MELEWLENVWCLFRHKRLIELDELSGRTTGRLGHTWPTTAYAIRGTAKAGTTILYHFRNCRRPHSSSVMTAGRRSCWSMGTAAASAGAAGPSEGLRAGRSSGQTKPEYTAASGRHDQATFRERANVSVRCLGLGARQHAMSDEARAGWHIVR